jgi:Tol biopolymer transport system component
MVRPRILVGFARAMAIVHVAARTVHGSEAPAGRQPGLWRTGMPSRGLLLSGVLGAFWLAATSVPVSATSPGPNGRIAFASDAAGDLDIWTMNADGSESINVTDLAGAPGFDLEPNWSPDGSKIAFRSGRTSAAEIYVVNADGTGLTQLTFNSVKDYAPAWSPDGSTIAFASNRNDPDPATCVGLWGCNIDIFVMPATGGSPVQVTFDNGSDAFPQFSPDGSFIAYDSDAGGVYAVYTVDVATLAVTKLTPDSMRAGAPDWSPDGTRLTFNSNNYPCKTGTSECRTDIFVMNANGSSIAQLTDKFGNNYDATWSSGGDKIGFTHSTGALFKQQQLYMMNPDGTGITRITRTNDESFGPDWSSD